jgi:ribosomal protein L15E
MCITNIFRVFKNASLVTRRGEIKISRVFSSGYAAQKARYVYYCSDNGILIYARRVAKGKTLYALIGD